MAETKASARDKTEGLGEIYQELAKMHLVALWNITSSLLPLEPQTRAISLSCPLGPGTNMPTNADRR
ncbi:MAG: hypothetical protein ACE5J5_09035 [Candidatus Hydrothermarchaeales archaeon]